MEIENKQCPVFDREEYQRLLARNEKRDANEFNRLWECYLGNPAEYEEQTWLAIRNRIFSVLRNEDTAHDLWIEFWRRRRMLQRAEIPNFQAYITWKATRFKIDCWRKRTIEVKVYTDDGVRVVRVLKESQLPVIHAEDGEVMLDADVIDYLRWHWYGSGSDANEVETRLSAYSVLVEQAVEESQERRDAEAPLLLAEIVEGKTLEQLAAERKIPVKSLRRKITRWANRRSERQEAPEITAVHPDDALAVAA